MRDLIDQLQKLNEQLDDDAAEVMELTKKHGFGTVAWQEAMLDRIKNKIQNNIPLSGIDVAFIETQIEHTSDILKSMGVPGGRLNVN